MDDELLQFGLGLQDDLIGDASSIFTQLQLPPDFDTSFTYAGEVRPAEEPLEENDPTQRRIRLLQAIAASLNTTSIAGMVLNLCVL